MITPTRSSLTRRTRAAAIAAALGAAAVGGLAFGGWLGGSPRLYNWAPGRGTLPILAALGILVIGLGVALVAPAWKRSWPQRLAILPAAAGFVLGGTILLPRTLAVDLGVDRLFPTVDPMGFDPTPPITALGLLIAALALGLLAWGRRRGVLYAQAFSLILLGIAGAELTGHLYGLETMLATPPFTAISLPGSLGLVLVGLGLLFARPEIGVTTLVVDPTAGGASVRRLLPVTVLVVILLGALRVQGGEAGYFPEALGTAIFAVTTAFLIGGLIVWNALALRDAELSLRREEEIRSERQRQFRQAIVNAPIPILMFAEDGEVLQVSRMVEEITGFAPGEIPDLKAWGRLVAGEEEGREAVGLLLASLGEAQEVSIRTREESPRTWRIRTSSLGLLNDGRAAYVAMATDITEIREAEERKNEFLAVLGHELRNPLAALASGLQLQGRHDDPRRQAEIREMMERQVRHFRRLLDDLLDVSRISRGKIELQTEILDLRGALQAIVEEHRDSLDSGAEIRLTLPPQPVPIRADATRLHQILGNVLGNASKYTPPDGTIWVTLEREEEEAVVRIRDSGVGIEEEKLADIFEPFQQIGREGTRRGGLGLGLTLVRQLATMHGGDVSVASRGLGHGSTFTLRLPLRSEKELPPEPAEEERLPAKAPPDTGKAVRILVVDDNREVADGFAEVLAMSGYEAVTAYDGEAALALDERLRPHVVFLDLQLPDLDGHQVAERIRDRRDSPPLLVAVSGYGGKTHVERSKAAGMDHHLVKPVDFDSVLEILQGLPAREGDAARV